MFEFGHQMPFGVSRPFLFAERVLLFGRRHTTFPSTPATLKTRKHSWFIESGSLESALVKKQGAETPPVCNQKHVGN